MMFSIIINNYTLKQKRRRGDIAKSTYYLYTIQAVVLRFVAWQTAMREHVVMLYICTVAIVGH